MVVTLLEKWFSSRLSKASDAEKRNWYGTVCSILGIFLNICLFIGKYLAGAISGSIAVMADAFNNMSDAGSSAITLIGFRLARRKPDGKHPFGYGRIEYLSGLLVSLAILVVGVELLQTSWDKIRTPEAVDAGWLTWTILAASIVVKFYMYFYNHRIGRKIGSAGMTATAADSISDAVATIAVLVASLIQQFTDWQIDGWCGLLVAVFILYTGVRSVWETIQPLLGQMPEPELVREIESLVLRYEEIHGIHDLVIHDYGPGRLMISLHAEVDGADDIFVLHDAIDRIEYHLATELECEAVIHMDPIAAADETTMQLRTDVQQRLKAHIHPEITIHDFRMVTGPTHTNLIFDTVIPYTFKESEETLKQRVAEEVHAMDEHYFAATKIDHAYTAL